MQTRNRLKLRPNLWFQVYWILYVIWFFALDWLNKDPKYIIYSPLDGYIPFCEWFIFPYCSWFFLLAGVTGLLWWFDTRSYDKLCLMMFSGMTFCLIVYMILPNGLDLRPAAEAVGRDNIAMRIMRLIWKADAPNNVCPSIHVSSTVAVGIVTVRSRLFARRAWVKVLMTLECLAVCWGTLVLQQHSVWDVAAGAALSFALMPIAWKLWPQTE